MSHVIGDEITALVINYGLWLRIVEKLCRRLCCAASDLLVTPVPKK